MKKKGIIFFDRDGTLIKAPMKKNGKPGSIRSFEHIIYTKGAAKLCKRLSKEFYLVMITNQPEYSRGINTKKNIMKINLKIKKELNLDKTYVCFCENNTCNMRKPNTGMIVKALRFYGLKAKNCYVIGDRWRDILAGKKAGCNTILLKKNYKERFVKPDYEVRNFDKINTMTKLFD